MIARAFTIALVALSLVTNAERLQRQGDTKVVSLLRQHRLKTEHRKQAAKEMQLEQFGAPEAEVAPEAATSGGVAAAGDIMSSNVLHFRHTIDDKRPKGRGGVTDWLWPLIAVFFIAIGFLLMFGVIVGAFWCCMMSEGSDEGDQCQASPNIARRTSYTI
eukprot:gnl/TRDRNA2_/TRDRNA2_181143_c0_seq1.p1 gnl/TRDRNA2_/TRDRNA2_181143_c0~~gnl/TRDRNA2_/TRDRNA2_181143_c0_seq1.p1  ORF type:complete len:160 (+),score=30.70 gnl/TRDRNA2_/TRDRNA2_181143_c0_seq1:122-601(+)